MGIKIIFVYLDLFTERRFVQLGGPYFETNGYTVEAWELLDKSRIKSSNNDFLRYNKLIFVNTKELPKRIKNEQKSIFVIFGAIDCYGTKSLLQFFSDCKSKYIWAEGLGPVYEPSTTVGIKKETKIQWLKRIFCRIKSGKTEYLKMVIDAKSQYYYRKKREKGIEKIKNLPLAILCSTKKSEEKYIPSSLRMACRIIYSHAEDYDNYLKIRNDKSYAEGVSDKYIVFVDSGFASTHYDVALIKNTDAKFYLDENEKKELMVDLNWLFDIMEEKYSIPVIVAGHPSVIYKKGDFNGRKIITGQTTKLVRDSEFVIMNWSTSINLVALFDKKLLVALNSSFRKLDNWEELWMPIFRYFDFNPLFLDEIDNKNDIFCSHYMRKMDNGFREKYITDYICDNDDDRLTVELIEQVIVSNVDKNHLSLLGKNN